MPVRASLWYMASGAVGKGVGIVATALFTRIMTGAEYGAYTVYMSWLGIAVTVSSAAASASVIYKRIGDDASERENLLASFTAIYAVFASIISVAVGVAMALSETGGGAWIFLWAQCVADGVVAIYLAQKKHSYSYKTVAVIGIAESVISPLVSYFLITGWGLGYLGRVIGYLTVPLAIAIVTTARRVLGGAKFFQRESWRRTVSLILPLIPYSAATAVSAQADRLVVSAALGHEGVAAYSVVHTVGSARVMLTTAIGSALYPWISRKLHAGRHTEIRRIISALATVYATLTVYTVDAAPELVALLAPERYSVALTAIVPLALCSLPSFLNGCMTVILLHIGDGGRLSLSSIASAAVSVIANLLLVGRLGYLGAALSTLAATCTMLTITVLGARKEGVSDALPIGKCAILFTITAVYCAVIYALYPYPVLRILMLIPPTLYALRDGVSVFYMLIEKNS